MNKLNQTIAKLQVQIEQLESQLTDTQVKLAEVNSAFEVLKLHASYYSNPNKPNK